MRNKTYFIHVHFWVHYTSLNIPLTHGYGTYQVHIKRRLLNDILEQRQLFIFLLNSFPKY